MFDRGHGLSDAAGPVRPKPHARRHARPRLRLRPHRRLPRRPGARPRKRRRARPRGGSRPRRRLARRDPRACPRARRRGARHGGRLGGARHPRRTVRRRNVCVTYVRISAHPAWQRRRTELGWLRAAMLGLISTPDPRYGGAPDPDEERERRWEPINWRISVSMTASLLCLIVSAATPTAITVVLHVSAVLLCAYAMRVAWPPRRPAEPDDVDA